MKAGSSIGKPRSAKPHKPKYSPAPKGSYLGKEAGKCGASANKPGKSGNCYE